MVEITADGGDYNNPYVIANKYLNKPPLTINDMHDGAPEYFSFKASGKLTTITITVDPNSDLEAWSFGGDLTPAGGEFGNIFVFDIELAARDKTVDFSVFYTGDVAANYSVTIG